MTEKTEALRLADELILALRDTDVEHWDTLEEAAAELRRLHAQRNALLEALKEYGWHHEGCPQYPTYTHPDRWPACTCGFDDAIKAVEGEKT